MSERKQKVIQQLNDFVSGKFLEDKDFILKCFEIDNIIGYDEVDYNIKLDEILEGKDETGLTWKDVCFNSSDPGKLFAMWMSEGNIGDLNYGVLQDYLYNEKKNTAEAFCDTPRIMKLLSHASTDPMLSNKELLIDSIIKVFGEHEIATYKDLDQSIPEVKEYKERHGILDEYNADEMAQYDMPPEYDGLGMPPEYGEMPPMPDFGEAPPMHDYAEMPPMPDDGGASQAPGNNFQGSRAPNGNAGQPKFNNQKEAFTPKHEGQKPLNPLDRQAMQALQQQTPQQQMQPATVNSDPLSSLFSGIGKTFGMGAGLATGLLTRVVGGRDSRVSPSEAFSSENLGNVCKGMKDQLGEMRAHLEVVSNAEEPLEVRKLSAEAIAKEMGEFEKNQAKASAAAKDPESKAKLAEVKKASDELAKDMKAVRDDEKTPDEIKKLLDSLIEAIQKFFNKIFGGRTVERTAEGPTQ